MRRLCLFLAATAAAFAAEGRDIVNYRIEARLLPQAHAIEGHQQLIWRNASPYPVPELRFHLYMNAFRDRKSTWARESGGPPDRLERDGWGSIAIQRLAIAGGADLTKAIRFIHPDDDNADDRTVISVPLPAPVASGGSIALEIDFNTRLPHVVERAGYHGDFYLAGQWFPKIGVWESPCRPAILGLVGPLGSPAAPGRAGPPAGPPGRWNCHQYHAWSEFFADYGRYDVSIDVPSDYVVGATGVNVSRTVNGSRATWRFLQADVHDFAWTASPRFVRAERQFGPVRMIVLLPPENASQIDRHFRSLATAIKYFGLWYGAYPYTTITLVDPPYGAREAGGMEYPTFITGWTSWILGPREQLLEDVIVHEFGHQYWYAMVGSNEFEESWLDEGFTTYSTGKILDLAYGPQALPFHPLRIPLASVLGLPLIGNDGIDRLGYLEAPKADDLVRNAWQYYNRSSYGVNSYFRAALTLRTLENYLGAPVMSRIMRTYFERWRYRHPTTLDFANVVSEVSGRDMRWFFDRFVFSSNVLDYAVSDIRDSTVRLRRLGEAILPVDLRVRFADGATEDRHWDGEYRWTEFKFTRPAAIESAEIDPDHKILLDVNFANNSRTRSVQAAPLAKWTENLLLWAEQWLLAVGAIA